MSKVWILLFNDEETFIVGVFDSKDAAEHSMRYQRFPQLHDIQEWEVSS